MDYNTLYYQMQKRNLLYYKNPKTKIYDDFLTYAQSKSGVLAQANAIDFYNHCISKLQTNSDLYPSFEILEIGVGNGAFAFSFLNKLHDLDKQNSTSLCSNLTYTLADFSSPMLARAKKMVLKNKSVVKLKFSKVDASILSNSKTKLQSKKYDLIRCNELFSDVPADLFCIKSSKLYQVLLSKDMQPKLVLAKSSQIDQIAKKIINSLPEEIFIPINAQSAKSILFLCANLKPGAIFDIFDYGFYFKHDFEILPDMWNLAIVRDYNSQWTVDLNFIYISIYLKCAGFKTHVQSQKDYVQSVFDKKFAICDDSCLDYVPLKPNNHKKRLENLQFDEDDSFYHMRITA